MKQLMFALLCFSSASFANHLIEELEGEWYSSIFPQTVRYHFFGVMPLDNGRYMFRYTRPTNVGDCIGSGVIQLLTGKARAVEVCPQRPDGTEPAFFAVWSLEEEHNDLHLKGGYYTEGSATFNNEDLDKDPH